MKEYPLEKYRFIINESKRSVIAITTDAGKSIRGIAKCDPTEAEFNIEYGKRLAAARANLKVAVRRNKRAKEAVSCALDCFNFAIQEYFKSLEFEKDSENGVVIAKQKLNEVLAEKR